MKLWLNKRKRIENERLYSHFCLLVSCYVTSVVVECDTQNYYSYQLLKEKEENLNSLFNRMQVTLTSFIKYSFNQATIAMIY